MKAIMISIRPQHACNILNLIKTLEIRKMFPSDYVGWVYIYATKDGKKGWCMVGVNGNETYYQKYDRNACYSPKYHYIGNGKVVARFWCDKVEEITTREDRFKEFIFYETSLDTEDLCKQSCLDYKELDNYLQGEKGKAIHVTNLEIFDKPKEISEFKVRKYEYNTPRYKIYTEHPLTRVPQSWCYVEV